MIRTAVIITLPLLVQGQAWAAFDQALPCLINPITNVQAGQPLDFKYGNAHLT